MADHTVGIMPARWSAKHAANIDPRSHKRLHFSRRVARSLRGIWLALSLAHMGPEPGSLECADYGEDCNAISVQ